MRRFRLVAVMLVAVVVVLSIVLPAAARSDRASATVKVTATEFKFSPSSISVKKGSVTFTLTNKGKLPHDLKVNGKKTALITKGKTASVTVKFTKAGKYSFVCTVPGHAAAGMKGTVTVK